MTPNRKQYLGIGCAAFAVWLFLFKSVGYLVQGRSTEIHQTALDARIDVIPTFVWIYFLAYLMPFAPFLFRLDFRAYNQALIAVFLATLTAFWVFLSMPFYIPQPELGDSLSERALELTYDMDFQPGANKMPALHVTIPLLVCVYMWRLRRGWVFKGGWFGVTLLVCASALFTKQHVVADVVLGAVWAVGAQLLTVGLFRAHELDELPPLIAVGRGIALSLLYYGVATGVLLLVVGCLRVLATL